MTKVYYNSACPVCNAGIKHQRARSAGDDHVEWIDVHADNDAVSAIGADLENVRERLHVVDDAGTVHIGAAAFAALWRITPGQRWLGRAGNLPVVRAVLRWAYNAFAAALYRWNRRRGHW